MQLCKGFRKGNILKKTKLVRRVFASATAFFVALVISTVAMAAPRTDMVDVSNNNGPMSAQEFIYMRNNYAVKAITTKISEGTYFQDGTAAGNIKAAEAAGLYINGYHFARYSTVAGAIAEANYAAQTAKADGLPVGAALVADVEAPQQRGNGYYTNTAANNAFINTVAQYGYRSTVYTMGSWVGSQFAVDKGWIAMYPYDPQGNAYSNNHGWQWWSSFYFPCSLGRFDVTQLYDNFFMSEQQPLVKSTDDSKQNVKASIDADKVTQSNTVANSDYAQSGTFTPNHNMNVRVGDSTNSGISGVLPAGYSIHYDHVFIANGYVWARYVNNAGYYRYIAMGANGGAEYGSRVKYTYVQPARHICIVESGDSFWSISRQFGVNMYTLMQMNNANAYTKIYPGERLYY